MKFITLFALSFSILPTFAHANTEGTKDKPVYKQCTVQLPQGNVAGVCKETGGKYFQIYTCDGELQAFVEPGALPTVYKATCGATHKGYPNG